MRPGAWLLLLLVPCLSAVAGESSSSEVPSRRRTVVLSARDRQGPPLEVHVAAGVATLLVFEAPLKPSVVLPAGEARFKLRTMEENEFVLLPVSDVPPNESILLTVDAGADVGLLRLSLVTRAEVDLRVRFIRAQDSAEDDAAGQLARQLLDTAEGQPLFVVPQREVRHQRGTARAQIDSVLWLGQRLFVTLSVRCSQRGSQPWQLAQVRLRTTLPDGVLQDWSARLVKGETTEHVQRHVFTSLMPAGATQLEVAFDSTDSAGAFHPL